MLYRTASSFILIVLLLVSVHHTTASAEPNTQQSANIETIGSIAIIHRNNELILRQNTDISGGVTDYLLQKLTPELITRLAVDPVHPIVLKNLDVVGSGGQNKVYKYENDTVLRAFPIKDEGEAKALIVMLNLQGMSGIVRIKRILKTNDGEIAVVFERLSKKDLGIDHLSETEFAKIAQKLSNILMDLHARGYKHKDISPGNIMFKGNDPVLIDFPSNDATTYGTNDTAALGASLIIMRLKQHYESLYPPLVKQIYSKLGHSNTLTSFFFKQTHTVSDADFYFDRQCNKENIVDCFGLNNRKNPDYYTAYMALKLLSENLNDLFDRPESELEKITGFDEEDLVDYRSMHKNADRYKLVLISGYCATQTSGAWESHIISDLGLLERSLYKLRRGGNLADFQKTLSGILDNRIDL